MCNRLDEGSGIIRDLTHYNETLPYTRYEKALWFGGRMRDDGFPPPDNYDNGDPNHQYELIYDMTN